jgi:hypothetical protein
MAGSIRHNTPSRIADVHVGEGVSQVRESVSVLGVLADDHDHDHGHHHHHDHAHGHHHHHHHDHNIRSAYLHVLADALTSVLAIVALLAG